MLKPSLSFLCAIVCVGFFGAPVLAQEQEKILFLHLRRDATGITLLDSQARPGILKSQAQRGSLEYEIDGEVQGQIPDPLIERFEYEDPAEPGRLRTHRVARASAEFTLRVPHRAAGRSLIFFERRHLEPGRLGALAERIPVGEVPIPAAPENLKTMSATAKLSTLLTNGPTTARLNIVILAEGFRTDQESSFTNRAKTVVTQFLNTSPYKEYRNHFNAFALFVPSAESGSDHPSRSIAKNTYFNSSYDSYGLDRLLTIPPNDRNSSYSAGYGKVIALLGQFVPDYDIALLLVNDSEYGGSGGMFSIASLHSSAAQIAIHEIGHSFGGLGDEYDSPYPGYPETEEPNTTRQTNRSEIKWRDWIQPSTPIPTPETFQYGAQVGLFEGAHFHSADWYRPKLDCKMQSIDDAFCEVCREALVLSTYTKLPIIQSFAPVANNLTVPGGGELLLQVSAVPPHASPLTYTWTIDGATNALFISNTFPASFATLGLGTHLVRAEVADSTPLVRTDRFGKLRQTRSWLVQVISETNQPPTLSTISDQTVIGPQLPPIHFTVADPDTPLDSILVSARSSNMNLVRDGDLIITGAGASRILTVRLSAPSGVARITIQASDGDSTVFGTFEITVSEPTPTLSLGFVPDQKTFTGAIAVSLPVSGANYGPLTFHGDSSNLLLLPNSGITFSAQGDEHFVSITPVNNGVGETSVTVTASDGALSAQTSFNVAFLARQNVVGAVPEVTSGGIRLRFTSEAAATMILEVSADLRFWTPMSSLENSTSFEFFVPASAIETKAFFRVRLVPL